MQNEKPEDLIKRVCDFTDMALYDKYRSKPTISVNEAIVIVNEARAVAIPLSQPPKEESGEQDEAEKIICSAIWFNDGKTYTHQPKNIQVGFVIAGRRHHNCYATLQSIGASLGMEGLVKQHIEKIDREAQGFITNTDRYVDRKEGMKIAKAAKQLIAPALHDDAVLTSEDLFSEDLY